MQQWELVSVGLVLIFISRHIKSEKLRRNGNLDCFIISSFIHPTSLDFQNGKFEDWFLVFGWGDVRPKKLISTVCENLHIQ